MSIESLLGDQSWLRRLARSLVRDEALADDLVQEGWLRALKNPPARHVRSWWRSVLVRRAIDLRREEQRRRAREERVPVPAAPPDDLLEKVEMQEAVARAVKGLAEPYRGVVLLRYFEGLPPRGIARRLGAPVETVRTQLKRAHALLRERLDAERRDWKGAMLLLAWPGSIPKLMGGMVAMAHTKKLSIVAVVLLLLSLSVFVTWRGLRGAAPPPRATEAAEAQVPATPTEESAPQVAPPAHDGWTIAVRTLRRDETVFPGATIEARVIADGTTVDEQQLASDAVGNATWLLPAYGQTVRLDLVATAPGIPEARREVVVAAGMAPPGSIDIRLGALDGLITGRVLGPGGEPLANATVECSTGQTTTGADGRFALACPASYTNNYVWARAEGYAFERVAVALRDGRGTADLHLREEFRIRGVVRDEEGRPVHGAIVRTFFTGFFQLAISDRDGRYVLAHLDPGRNQHQLQVGHPGYAPFWQNVPTSGTEATVDIVLARGLACAGRVEDPDGSPVAGAKLTFPQILDPIMFSSLAATTREDGTFDFGPRLLAGEQPLVVDHGRFAQLSMKVVFPVGEPLRIRLEAAHYVAGVAVDDQGAPIVIHMACGNRRAKSDASGKWRIEGVPGGTVSLEFFGRGFQRVRTEAEADCDDVRVTVPRAAVVRGRVVDDATGAPVPSFTLRVTRATGSGGLSATWVREGYRIDDEDGRWTIDEEFAPGGTADVEVRVDGYMPGYGSAVAAIDADPDACVVRLTKGSAIEGIVLDADTGKPIEGADVRADPPGIIFDETYRRRVQRTGADGRFRFPAAEPGLVLSVEHTGYAPFVEREIGETPLTIRLHTGCVIEGTASPGDEVALVGDANSRDTVADEKGRFRFDHLPEGTYAVAKRLRFEKPPYTWFAYPVVRTVEATRTRPVDIELSPLGTATIRGKVARETDTEGNIVYLARDGERMPRSVLVHEGRFEFTGVEAGRYRLIPQPGDPKGSGKEIEIRDGETREVTLGTAD